MAYLALIAGANGLGVYAWDDRLDKKTGWHTKEHPEDMAVLRAGIQELKSLESVLLIPNSERKALFTPRNSALHAAVKESGGKTYLLVASDSRREEEGSLAVDGLSDAVAVCLADGRSKESIHIKGGKAPLKLPALSAAVYEIK